MKIVVIWVAGCLLLCVAAAAGYYAGKMERGDADQDQFTYEIIEGEADMAEVRNSTEARGDFKRIITFDSGNYYVSAPKNAPASAEHRSEHQCVLDADEAMIHLDSALSVFDNCQRTRAKP